MSNKHSAEYDDAFNEGEADTCNGIFRNNYKPGTDARRGYNAGVKSFQPIRADWEAQAHYDACWNAEPFDAMAAS